MAVTFNNDSGFVAEETSVVRANIAQEWKNAFATDPNLPQLDTNAETPAGQLIDGQTALASEKDNDIIYVSNMFNPKNAVGVPAGGAYAHHQGACAGRLDERQIGRAHV